MRKKNIDLDFDDPGPLKTHKNRAEYQKEYRKRPEAIESAKKYLSTPKVKKRIKEYQKEYQREYQRKSRKKMRILEAKIYKDFLGILKGKI